MPAKAKPNAAVCEARTNSLEPGIPGMMFEFQSGRGGKEKRCGEKKAQIYNRLIAMVNLSFFDAGDDGGIR